MDRGGQPVLPRAENKRLQDVFEYLNPLVASADAHISHDTVRKRAVAEFEKHKEKVIEVLKNAPGLIHISFDGWRSRNKQSLHAVACFFRDEDGKARKLILGLPELTVRHLGPLLDTKSSRYSNPTRSQTTRSGTLRLTTHQTMTLPWIPLGRDSIFGARDDAAVAAVALVT